MKLCVAAIWGIIEMVVPRRSYFIRGLTSSKGPTEKSIIQISERYPCLSPSPFLSSFFPSFFIYRLKLAWLTLTHMSPDSSILLRCLGVLRDGLCFSSHFWLQLQLSILRVISPFPGCCPIVCLGVLKMTRFPFLDSSTLLPLNKFMCIMPCIDGLKRWKRHCNTNNCNWETIHIFSKILLCSL